MLGSLIVHGTALALALALHSSSPWCGPAHVTGYVRSDGSSHTADGTHIMTDEPIAAASYDVVMGSLVDVEGVGTFTVRDRGHLGNGNPTWIDIAVWTRDEAYALTGTRNVCIRRAEEE
jgi:3D (Asp-Asp-Asp) domain-containing protein